MCDESGMGDDVSTNKTVDFWFVRIIIGLCFLCAVGCWMFEMESVA